MESSFRLLRTVQVAMLVSIGLYAFIAKDHGPAPKEVSLIFVCMMAALAAGMIAAALVVRRVLVKPAESTLATNPENAAALHAGVRAI